MRIIAILAAILLVALQVRAGPLQARGDEAPGQEQRGPEDQDISISFAWDKSSALQVSGSTRGMVCSCRLVFCRRTELRVGNCLIGGVSFTYCCTRVD
ncbi:DEFA4 isoform 1 [Pan troglodytes]|uniref:Defensin alpha 4 n=2 Tax=Pan troglodytes TaxID=9598 RepID=DEF4_PANTR|nr:defensin alpha 4 precursor [Pan troglodytes]XP_009453052.1 defensin alpha 4 isoform X1 [Pan troglodytes]Q5G862.1 RecName: Full=Defensin alpha 4; AltName: Full=Corticostatin HP-4; AltName: Full=HNP-4; Short=HP-4; AltName: Full=Neutrophil defensin 4; Flags: Precursor [Pan troglodytes]AAW78341.1 defensin alpha 4 [Pan troglodytes]PNI23072.1 DEFA4 isoform 1 [Pan troglodytes]